MELEHEKVIVRRQGRGIVAARGVGCLEQLPEEKEKPQIVLVSPDYPAETIWRLTYMTEQYAVQKGFGVLQSRICEGACYAAFCDLAKRTRNCAALLIISPAERFSFETLETFGRLKLPVVLIDHLFLYDELPDNVYCMQHDPAVAGERMASCLLERGHTEIGYVRNEPQSDYDLQKQNAFVRTLKKAGVSMSSRIFSETIRCWENSLEAARRIVGRNLERIRESGITALGFSSSPGAFAAIQVLRNAGFEVPGDAWGHRRDRGGRFHVVCVRLPGADGAFSRLFRALLPGRGDRRGTVPGGTFFLLFAEADRTGQYFNYQP